MAGIGPGAALGLPPAEPGWLFCAPGPFWVALVGVLWVDVACPAGDLWMLVVSKGRGILASNLGWDRGLFAINGAFAWGCGKGG